MNKGLLAVIGLVALALGLPIGLSFVPALTVACPTTGCGGGGPSYPTPGPTPLPTPKPVVPLPISSSPYISWIRLASAGVITIAAILAYLFIPGHMWIRASVAVALAIVALLVGSGSVFKATIASAT